MKFLRRMEQKYGRYAITNLTQYIIVTYIAGYLLQLFAPSVLAYMTLEPYFILHGQVWRIVSWILIPPSSFNILVLITLFFYYSIGTMLERSWGAFLYNVYIFMGLLMTILGSFLLYGILYVLRGNAYLMGSQFSTYYISMSIFFGFAMTYPDMQVMLYFIIPLKIKWMAAVYGIVIGYEALSNLAAGYWPRCIAILCSITNVLVFYAMFRKLRRGPARTATQKNFTRATARTRTPQGRTSSPQAGNAGITIHKCAICGRTEKDNPNLEFRFCSKCNGNYEYCQEHLFTHTHIQ